jgi:transmembrane sensor
MMEEYNMEDILTIISRYLSGSASEKDMEDLNAWRKIDVANEKKFQELSECWQIIQADKHRVTPDKEKVWAKIMQDINRADSDIDLSQLSIPKRRFFTHFRYVGTAIAAATIALLIGFAIGKLPIGNMTESNIEWTSMTSPSDGKTELCLADGTHVWLNANSTIYYPTNFGRKSRDIRLKGQAYFDVTKDKDRQFCVAIDGVKIKVLGTAFDINGYKDSKSIEVIVHRGHVNVVNGSTDNMLADLYANQKTIVDKNGLSKGIISNCDVDVQSLWRMDYLKINGENLEKIANKLENWYNVRISLGRYNANKLYWITIKKETLKETLNVINKINHINYHISGKEVKISER